MSCKDFEYLIIYYIYIIWTPITSTQRIWRNLCTQATKQHCNCDLAHLERQHLWWNIHIQVLEQHVLPSRHFFWEGLAFFSRTMLITKTTKLQQPPQKHECFSFFKAAALRLWLFWCEIKLGCVTRDYKWESTPNVWLYLDIQQLFNAELLAG